MPQKRDNYLGTLFNQTTYFKFRLSIREFKLYLPKRSGTIINGLLLFSINKTPCRNDVNETSCRNDVSTFSYFLFSINNSKYGKKTLEWLFLNWFLTNTGKILEKVFFRFVVFFWSESTIKINERMKTQLYSTLND